MYCTKCTRTLKAYSSMARFSTLWLLNFEFSLQKWQKGFASHGFSKFSTKMQIVLQPQPTTTQMRCVDTASGSIHIPLLESLHTRHDQKACFPAISTDDVFQSQSHVIRNLSQHSAFSSNIATLASTSDLIWTVSNWDSQYVFPTQCLSATACDYNSL